MTEAINNMPEDPLSRFSIRAAPAQSQPGTSIPALNASSSSSSSSGGSASAAPQQQQAVPGANPAATKPQGSSQKGQYGAAYYSGMVTSGLSQDNGASPADMLKRSLRLAGGVAALLGLLTYGFLASNGLV
eukprot:CAMPEP_0202871216 /NCGR_PEP_ID=MMETSP1391-20130828/18107_1 /ASSEMBLY_ACC=CAM_ASM_000867 /TAXON_ID=1034604 /ORGANISM="Chlamydomonas leiostraca, Strain SAG 11-49" /LENGTH=130 /DNA_ID=CAMNT_0049551951 /DNA_START=86 /DNA_END=478 /DNA_ORIENTATION=+